MVAHFSYASNMQAETEGSWVQEFSPWKSLEKAGPGGAGLDSPSEDRQKKTTVLGDQLSLCG